MLKNRGGRDSHNCAKAKGLMHTGNKPVKQRQSNLALAVASVIATILTLVPARANVITTFDLDGVTFADGGIATGSFVLDLTTYLTDPIHLGPELISVDITTTNGAEFSGTTYDALLWFFGAITGDPGEEPGQIAYLLGVTNETNTASLVFAFLQPLSTTTPDPLFLGLEAYPGEDFEQSAGPPPVFGVRALSSGSLDPVSTVVTTEPPTIVLFAFGLTVLGLIPARWLRKGGSGQLISVGDSAR